MECHEDVFSYCASLSLMLSYEGQKQETHPFKGKLALLEFQKNDWLTAAQSKHCPAGSGVRGIALSQHETRNWLRLPLPSAFCCLPVRNQLPGHSGCATFLWTGPMLYASITVHRHGDGCSP